jgi:hypothetical protein
MLSTLELVPAISPPIVDKVQVVTTTGGEDFLVTSGCNCFVADAACEVAFGRDTYLGAELRLQAGVPVLFDVPSSATRCWGYGIVGAATISSYACTGGGVLDYSVPFAPDYIRQWTPAHGVVDLGIHGATEMLVATYEPCFIVFGSKAQQAALPGADGLPLYPDYPMRFKLDVASTFMYLYGASSATPVFFSYLGRTA